jgi:hypothetical protein
MAENSTSQAFLDEDLSSEPEKSRTHVSSRLSPGFFTLLALFLAFRLLTLFLLRPGGFIRDWSDFDTYLGIAKLSDYGLYPYLHYWLEWPPVVPWLMVAAYKLSLLIPAWPDERLWFILILGGVFVLFEAGNFILLYRLACRLVGEEKQISGEQQPDDKDHQDPEWAPGLTEQVLRPLWLYALLFVPIYAMLGFFDGVALFFLLLALELLLRGRLLSSAVSVGVGFLVKLTPIIFLPVALRRLWEEAEDWRSALRDGALYIVTTALTIMLLLLPFLLINPVWLLAAARAITGRSSWETVWAILEDYFGYGVVGGDRLNPAETNFAVHPSTLPWWLITLGFGVLYLVLWTRPADYRRSRTMVALTGLTVALFLLYSKGYSPQFLVYLLPFILLLFPDARGVTYSLLLTLLNILEQPVYFVLVPDATWLLEGIVLARWLVLGVLVVEFGLIVWGASLRRLARVVRYAPAGLSVLIGLAVLAGTPLLGRAYAEQRLQEDPAAPLVGFLKTEQAQRETAIMVVSDQDFMRRVRPYLGGDYDVRLAGGDRLYEAAPAVADLISGTEKVWVVTSGEEASRVTRDLERQGRMLLSYDFGVEGELRLFTPDRAGAAALPPVARLGNGSNLIGYAVERRPGNQIGVVLYWWAAATPPQSYTVFTQILDGEGNSVAGHDGLPAAGAAPTETWEEGRVYRDEHTIELPAGLPAGDYRVVAGMYDFDLNRVIATGPDAVAFRGRAIPLGEIQLP